MVRADLGRRLMLFGAASLGALPLFSGSSRGRDENQDRLFHDSFVGDCVLRSTFDCLCRMGDVLGARRRCRLSADAGNCGRRARRRAGLPAPAISDDRDRRHRHLRAARLLPRLACCHRLFDRRGAVGRGRLHRHERVGARQRAHGAGRDQVARRRARTGLQSRCDYRNARRGSRAARRHALLRLPDRDAWPLTE